MTSTSGTQMSSLQTPIITRKNYAYWSLKMNYLFGGEDVWEIIQNGYTEPSDEATYNNIIQDEKDLFR